MKTVPIPRLDSNRILNELRTERFARSLLIVDRCTSTNDIAVKFAHDGAPEGFTVISEEQTEGRGRYGRLWFSPKGGIWLTVILRPPVTFELLNGLPLVGALAVARTISSNLGLQALVRWPNDVVVDRRKLAGVLVETKFSGNVLEFALLGLGVNANFHASLMQGISERSASLLDHLGSPVDREAFICSLLQETERLYDLVVLGGVADVLRFVKQTECSRGRRIMVKVENGAFAGVLDDYESLTRIRISTSDGSYKSVDTGSVIAVDYLDG